MLHQFKIESFVLSPFACWFTKPTVEEEFRYLLFSVTDPSYDLNSTGPGVMLASYTGPDAGLRWISVSEEEHVAYVLAAMERIHGPIARELYTGSYNRRCWLLDPLETVSWASASIGMRQAWIPEFFTTQQGVIVSGEGTSYTSSWSKFDYSCLEICFEPESDNDCQLPLHSSLVYVLRCSCCWV